jgi:pimeloyl-ACP methyl ester carboxylesterase
LAEKEPVSGLALLAPALVPRVNLFERLFFRLGVHLLPWVRPRHGWTKDVLSAMKRARTLISKLRGPIFAAQCEDDELISPISLRVVQRLARNSASRFKAFPAGGHAILAAHGASSLNTEITKFFLKK